MSRKLILLRSRLMKLSTREESKSEEKRRD
jgi:hypothetical protein